MFFLVPCMHLILKKHACYTTVYYCIWTTFPNSLCRPLRGFITNVFPLARMCSRWPECVPAGPNVFQLIRAYPLLRHF
jgi:hypothetical protein